MRNEIEMKQKKNLPLRNEIYRNEIKWKRYQNKTKLQKQNEIKSSKI